MLFVALLSLALADDPSGESPASDVKVLDQVKADPEAITTYLSDLENWERMMPESCVEEWVHGIQTEGIDARTRVSYTIGAMNRRLTADLTKVVPGRLVELDHLGNKGFITRVLVENGDRSPPVVRLESYVNEPPWPFKKYYYNKIHPAWVTCYEQALVNLEEQLSK